MTLCLYGVASLWRSPVCIFFFWVFPSLYSFKDLLGFAALKKIVVTKQNFERPVQILR